MPMGSLLASADQYPVDTVAILRAFKSIPSIGDEVQQHLLKADRVNLARRH